MSKTRMLDLYRGHRSELGRHLGAIYMDMLDDLPGVPPAILHGRLFAWLPRRAVHG